MPVYDFKCEVCGLIEEQITPMKTDRISCPKCNIVSTNTYSDEDAKIILMKKIPSIPAVAKVPPWHYKY